MSGRLDGVVVRRGWGEPFGAKQSSKALAVHRANNVFHCLHRARVGLVVLRQQILAPAEPAGSGVLTKCRGWLVASSCRTYHHISLPSRIAVGDTIVVSFGSDPKEFRFFVARIALKGNRCAILSEATGDRHRMDKINVNP